MACNSTQHPTAVAVTASKCNSPWRHDPEKALSPNQTAVNGGGVNRDVHMTALALARKDDEEEQNGRNGSEGRPLAAAVAHVEADSGACLGTVEYGEGGVARTKEGDGVPEEVALGTAAGPSPASMSAVAASASPCSAPMVAMAAASSSSSVCCVVCLSAASDISSGWEGRGGRASEEGGGGGMAAADSEAASAGPRSSSRG